MASDLEPFEINIAEIAEVDMNCWFERREPTLREVSLHTARIVAADLTYPIILNDNGALMDGGHRICKALLEGQETIWAVRFEEMPSPDAVLAIDQGLPETLG